MFYNLISFISDNLGEQDSIIFNYNQTNEGRIHTFSVGGRSKEGFSEIKPFYFFNQIINFLEKNLDKQCETDFSFSAQEEKLVSGWITVRSKDCFVKINFSENFKGKKKAQ